MPAAGWYSSISNYPNPALYRFIFLLDALSSKIANKENIPATPRLILLASIKPFISTEAIGERVSNINGKTEMPFAKSNAVFFDRNGTFLERLKRSQMI